MKAAADTGKIPFSSTGKRLYRSMAKSQNKNRSKNAKIALLVSTFALIINFWAWSLLSPLGARYANELALNPIALSLLLALPIIIGSLGRIVVGLITDNYGPKKVFQLICLASAASVIALSVSHSYAQLLVAAVFLGIGGAAFVIGIPLVSAWFPPEKRGFVLGLYSMGNAGTAVSGLLTPRLDTLIGRRWTFLLVAALLVIMAIVFHKMVKNAPGWKPAKTPVFTRLKSAATNPVTRDLSLVYIITFGAYVAFGVYLPVLLKIAYNLDVTDAAARAAGFVLLATLARPVGGWLSDQIGGKNVIKSALIAVTVLAGFVAFQPKLYITTTVAYLSLAFALGCSNGAVFALIGKLTRPEQMGSISGMVGAAGGLGGFIPPLILGLSYQQTNSYSFAFVLLSASAAIVYLIIRKRFRSEAYNSLLKRAAA